MVMMPNLLVHWHPTVPRCSQIPTVRDFSLPTDSLPLIGWFCLEVSFILPCSRPLASQIWSVDHSGSLCVAKFGDSITSWVSMWPAKGHLYWIREKQMSVSTNYMVVPPMLLQKKQKHTHQSGYLKLSRTCLESQHLEPKVGESPRVQGQPGLQIETRSQKIY